MDTITMRLDELKGIMQECATNAARQVLDSIGKPDTLYNRKQAAEYLGMSVENFDNVKQHITAVYPGKVAKYNKSALDEYKAKRTIKRA